MIYEDNKNASSTKAGTDANAAETREHFQAGEPAVAQTGMSLPASYGAAETLISVHRIRARDRQRPALSRHLHDCLRSVYSLKQEWTLYHALCRRLDAEKVVG